MWEKLASLGSHLLIQVDSLTCKGPRRLGVLVEDEIHMYRSQKPERLEDVLGLSLECKVNGICLHAGQDWKHENEIVAFWRKGVNHVASKASCKAILVV